MRSDVRYAKTLMEMWGTSKRKALATLGYPRSTPVFDPTNYEYLNFNDPSYKRKRIRADEESKFRQMKQNSTKRYRTPATPYYIGDSTMNHIDNIILEMSPIYREVAELKFIDQMKDKEISEKIDRTIRAVENRVNNIYKIIINRIDRDKVKI